jgi:hypothetical protein
MTVNDDREKGRSKPLQIPVSILRKTQSKIVRVIESIMAPTIPKKMKAIQLVEVCNHTIKQVTFGY